MTEKDIMIVSMIGGLLDKVQDSKVDNEFLWYTNYITGSTLSYNFASKTITYVSMDEEFYLSDAFNALCDVFGIKMYEIVYNKDCDWY
jgi:hypothetical protein